MGSSGCLTARNALIFNYRALDQAVIDLRVVISKAYKGKPDSR